MIVANPRNSVVRVSDVLTASADSRTVWMIDMNSTSRDCKQWFVYCMIVTARWYVRVTDKLVNDVCKFMWNKFGWPPGISPSRFNAEWMIPKVVDQMTDQFPFLKSESLVFVKSLTLRPPIQEQSHLKYKIKRPPIKKSAFCIFFHVWANFSSSYLSGCHSFLLCKTTFTCTRKNILHKLNHASF